MASYRIHKANAETPHITQLQSMAIDAFHPQSSTHRPEVELTLWHNRESLNGLFTVDDNYVIVQQTEYNSDVWKDSCVELFLSVPEIEGYFNFEFSGGGAFRVFHIRDHERVGPVFKEYAPVSPHIGKQITVKSSLPERVFPVKDNPTLWELHFTIPLSFFRAFHKEVSFEGVWQGNAFKCAGESSHPHWASWVPIGDELNFHQPERFGALHFEN